MQRKGKTLKVYLLDKFPMLVDYIDLVDSIRLVGPVRLGAYLGPGTVVMPSGFANFGAYVTGPNMIEGRVPIGTTVGANTDVGGGASIMGTTSGGNDVVVNIGEYVLLEAMSGLGIPIGDRVRNEVGFYVKATTPIWINLYDPDWDDNEVIERLRGEHPMASPAGEGAIDFDGVLKVKAIDLAGISDAIFRRDADNGRPSVVPRGDNSWGKLTDYLHS
jgi:2,3,4,5-tetrahydropyridine-2-carboxylate N-succinyltransferase